MFVSFWDLTGTADEVPAKFQSDRTILSMNLTASRLYEILRKDVLSDIGTGPWRPCLTPTSASGHLAANGVSLCFFLHDQTWISLWIKLMANKLDITIHVIASQLSGHCDVISKGLWRHQQNVNRMSETWGQCVKVFVFIIIYGFVMLYKN